MHSIWINISIWSGVAAWVIAQICKLFTFMIRERKFDYAFLFRLGGMPSSHTASSVACATSIGLRMGFGSSAFAVAFGLVAIIMVDAQTVRRAAGKQARLLNQMMDDLYRHKPFSQEKLVEFLGHTRIEVFIGLLLGVLVALGFHYMFPAWAAMANGF